MMYLDHVTVYKRIVPTSIQYDRKSDDIFPKNRVRMVMDWKFQYKKEALGPIWRMLLKYSLWMQKRIISMGNSNKLWKCRVLFFIFKYTDPFAWCERRLAHNEKKYLPK